MSWKKSLLLSLVASLVLLIPMNLVGRDAQRGGKAAGAFYTANAVPNYCTAQHDVGRIVLGVGNYGVIGGGDGFVLGSASDCFTGQRVLSCEYPKNSRSNYLYSGAFWIGAIVGRDTLVSMGADGWLGRQSFHPDEGSFGQMLHRSIMDQTKPEFVGALSEQDFIAVYTDTFESGVQGLENDEITGLPHMALGIEVTQRSFAWSYPYAEDFVLFDFAIKNIKQERLEAVYMGIYVDADVNQQGDQDGFDDDVCGFQETMTTYYGGCEWIDTINAAWIADNDGEMNDPNAPALPHVTATRIVRTPSDSLQVSFNWWVSNGSAPLDFGPRWKEHSAKRALGTGGQGTPAGVRNKYAFMKNGEFDYDQIFTGSIKARDSVWSLPNQLIAGDISNGFDTRYLLSFGPFNVDPGQTLPLSLAYLAGANFHTDPENLRNNLQRSYDPDEYRANLDLTDLALNSVWASWIYDNPGVDSDSDGYRGEFRLCCDDSNIVEIIDTVTPHDTIWEFNLCDSVYYVGDGVPDFTGAKPPAPPVSRVESQVGKIKVYWNGAAAETEEDSFTREQDFEGYRVYLARDLRETSYAVVASYDLKDYNKLVYNAGQGIWELFDIPYTAQDLRCLYGASCDDESFDPDLFGPSRPYVMPGFPDSVFVFDPQDHNRSELGVTTPIKKAYPYQPYPSSLNPELADPSELTPQGLLKYFEYEYTFEDVLPSVVYFVSVTAFDYGSPQSGLASLETSRTLNPIETYALPTFNTVKVEGLEVYVYPNPYIGDGRYRAAGYEDDFYGQKEKNRIINFANLPAKCTISIFSLDGDLVFEKEHDVDPNDPLSSHDEWDTVTRNTQPIVTGIYYYTVDDGNTVQTGKIVFIL